MLQYNLSCFKKSHLGVFREKVALNNFAKTDKKNTFTGVSELVKLLRKDSGAGNSLWKFFRTTFHIMHAKNCCFYNYTYPWAVLQFDPYYYQQYCLLTSTQQDTTQCLCIICQSHTHGWKEYNTNQVLNFCCLALIKKEKRKYF